MVRRKYKIPRDSEQWTSSGACKGLGHPARSRDVVDLGYQIHNAKLPSDMGGAPCEYVADISQDGSREPFSIKCRSLVSNSCLFFYPRDRTLIPKEHLMLLGWPSSVRTHSISQSGLRDLAGEAMAVPCISLASQAVIFSLRDPSLWEHPLCDT